MIFQTNSKPVVDGESECKMGALIVVLVILGLGLLGLLAKYDSKYQSLKLRFINVLAQRDEAVVGHNTARHEVNLRELELAIVRFTRDKGQVPRSMSELYGPDHGQDAPDYMNPYTGKGARVLDPTGKPVDTRVVEPNALSFEFLAPQGPGSERCVITIHDAKGRIKQACMISAPAMVTA